jgi:hypothetical protein
MWHESFAVYIIFSENDKKYVAGKINHMKPKVCVCVIKVRKTWLVESIKVTEIFDVIADNFFYT